MSVWVIQSISTYGIFVCLEDDRLLGYGIFLQSQGWRVRQFLFCIRLKIQTLSSISQMFNQLTSNIFSILKMKRTSQKFASSKKSLFGNRKNPSVSIRSDQYFAYALLDKIQPPNFNSTSDINFILAFIEQGLFDTIDRIQEKRSSQRILQLVTSLQTFVKGGMCPEVGDYDEPNFYDQEPNQICIDNLCGGDTAIQRRFLRKGIDSFSHTPKQEETRSKVTQSFNQNHNQAKNSKQYGLVPLVDIESQKDLKTTQFQSAYRDKYLRRESIQNEQALKSLPNLLKKFKVKGDKQTQFNFDYDGAKITINSGTVVKSNQVNVLKTVYRIHKDRHDIQKSKKMNQSIVYTKLPTVPIPSKLLLSSTTEVYQLKNCIQKSINQKGCTLSSIKMLPTNEN